MGGSLTAVAPDFNRAVLGVPGMNYCDCCSSAAPTSTTYAQLLYPAYPDELDRAS